MASADENATSDEQKHTTPQSLFEFELRGNSLVCKCHGRVIVTFAPDALAAFREKHGK